MAKMLTKYQTFTSINKETKADIFRDVIDIFTGLGVLIFVFLILKLQWKTNNAIFKNVMN